MQATIDRLEAEKAEAHNECKKFANTGMLFLNPWFHFIYFMFILTVTSTWYRSITAVLICRRWTAGAGGALPGRGRGGEGPAGGGGTTGLPAYLLV